MKNRTVYYWIIIALLCINITAIHGFVAISPQSYTNTMGNVSFFSNIVRNGMLVPAVIGYGLLIYFAYKIFVESKNSK